MPQELAPQRYPSIEGHSELGPKPVITFLLVHGTFAIDADWVHDDTDARTFRTKMRDQLKDEYEVRFDVFPWGYRGRVLRLMDNTDARRLYGVGAFGKHLVNCEDVSASNQRYVVAHSHGGNIVMSALRDPELRNKVTGVICLSSPFLVHDLARFRRELLFLSCVTLLAAVWGSWTYAWIYAVFYTAIVATILFAGKTEASIEEVVERRGLLKLAGREQFQDGMAPGPRFLAIRPHRDEVTILFWITRGVGTVCRSLWRFLNGVGGMLVFLFLLFGVLVDKFPSLVTISWLNQAVSIFRDFVLPPLMISATFVLSVMVVMRWSYAFDAVPWIASMDVRSKNVPWDGARMEYAPVFEWFKHTSIQNQSPPIIARWVREVDVSPEAAG